MIKKILNRAAWVLVFTLVIFLLVFANIERNSRHTSELKVTLHACEYPSLTSADRIQSHILENMPSIIGQSKNTSL